MSARGASLRLGRAAAVALGSIALIALGGCSDNETPNTDPTDSQAFSEKVERVIAEAEAGGAGEAQLAILREAAAGGEITLGQAQDATRATIACFEMSGLAATYDLTTEESGLQIPSYGVQAEVEGMTDQQVEQLIDKCDAEEGFWVNYLYQTQPASHQVRETHVRSRLPVLLECLREHGVEMDADDDIDEIVYAANQLLFDSIDSAEPINCMSEAGIGSY